MTLALPKQEDLVFAKPKGDERSRITRMRTALVMGSPFYGLCSMKLKVVEKPEVTTAATDGKSLFYNPDYVAGMSDAKLKGLVGHETLHCVAGHIWRRGTREHRLWNVACDYAIDQILQRAGFDVPNALVNPDWAGWSAEQIYAALLEEVEKQRQKGKQQNGGDANEGEGTGEGGGYQQALDLMFGESPSKGQVLDAPQETAIRDQAEWKQAISAAAQIAKSQGKMPGNLEILVAEALEARVDWKAVLRRFVQMCATLDYSWRSPSTRYAPLGLYLPRLRSEQMPPIVIGVDTSGSIGGGELRAFAGEVSSIIEEANPETTHLVFCDARVQSVKEFLPGDPIIFKPAGGGGTNMMKIFEWVDEKGIEPACVVVLTDCYTPYEGEVPAYPVIWASTTKEENLGNNTPPFGEVLFLDFE